MIKDQLPDLRLSPLGVVPQRERRPRTICDYTFFGVNEETEETAPMEAMQFGKALHRIMTKVHQANPAHGPVYMSKVDIADGFYRVWIQANDIPKLGMLFPARDGEELMIAFPLVLPMGWKESPPNFSAATETVADMANANIADNTHQPEPHRLETVSETPPEHDVQSPHDEKENTTNAQQQCSPTTALPQPTTAAYTASRPAAGNPGRHPAYAKTDSNATMA
ncbi:unknown protein [Seminavis robusta]|uniref:Uncharacterized protein n=1 Tax=Seminavis robusta TaxID=568900 RepID=A0A9N8DJX7_9STRA|nr:unknown protein [Seminavis robusta]|eukprot:Sro99_g051010.1 n/a (223) ;mRNA; f:89965-90914